MTSNPAPAPSLPRDKILTMIAALRLYQRLGRDGSLPDDILAIATDNDALPRLSLLEIDKLCRQLETSQPVLPPQTRDVLEATLTLARHLLQNILSDPRITQLGPDTTTLIETLLSDINRSFALPQDDDPKLAQRYRNAAKRDYHRGGEIEIAENATVSLSDDDGAYVQAWVWVAADHLEQ